MSCLAGTKRVVGEDQELERILARVTRRPRLSKSVCDALHGRACLRRSGWCGSRLARVPPAALSQERDPEALEVRLLHGTAIELLELTRRFVEGVFVRCPGQHLLDVTAEPRCQLEDQIAKAARIEVGLDDWLLERHDREAWARVRYVITPVLERQTG